MKILRNEQDTNLQTIYSQEKCLKSPQSISRNRIHHKIQKKSKKSKEKTRHKDDEIRKKSSMKESRKRKHTSESRSHDHKKSRKVIVNHIFSDAKDNSNEMCSFMEQKWNEKPNGKISFTTSTLVVTELLHEMIDSIFKSSSKTVALVQNPMKTREDDVQSIESGEINSDSDSECAIIFKTKKVTTSTDDHTCYQGLLCPKCIHFKFQGSKKIGPGHNKFHNYSAEFNLELSTEIFDLLKCQKINLKLLCVENSFSFKILEKSITLKDRILENARVQVSFYSSHWPE